MSTISKLTTRDDLSAAARRKKCIDELTFIAKQRRGKDRLAVMGLLKQLKEVVRKPGSSSLEKENAFKRILQSQDTVK